MPRGADYKSAVPASEVNEVSKTYDDESDAIGVLLGALAAKSFDLALICKRWKQLPEAVKTGIMAMVLVLGPIFEADLLPEQFAYRPNRSAHDAVLRVMRLLETGCREVVDADLSGYFDSIPHAELMKSVARRTSDRHVLRLIKMWLELPVEETDKRGRKRRTCRNRDEGRGTPQGAPISPLLANLYMRLVSWPWKVLGVGIRGRTLIVVGNTDKLRWQSWRSIFASLIC